MRVCVLSDIHSNLPALDAVLAAVGPVDAVWQLGDIVGYGPQPSEVVERLREVGAIGVCGNHDLAAIGRIGTELFNDDARAAADWTTGQLTDAARTWLDALPSTHSTSLFTLVHGSPRDPVWEYVYAASVARANLSSYSTPHCLVGHTHVPLAFVDEGDHLRTIEPEHGTRLVLDERRTILNPGSVGQPRDGDRRACAMTIELETRTVQWFRIDYPIDAVQARMREAGLPDRLVQRLSEGL